MNRTIDRQLTYTMKECVSKSQCTRCPFYADGCDAANVSVRVDSNAFHAAKVDRVANIFAQRILGTI